MFDKPVTATAATLLGLPAGTRMVGVTGSGTTVVRWRFAAAVASTGFAPAAATAGPAAVTNLAGTAGLAQPFARTIRVLVGGVTGNGLADHSDLVAARSEFSAFRANPLAYDPTADMDGDGDIDADDLRTVQLRFGSRLP